MAQLPPKIPNMSPDWTSFGHQKKTTSMSWVDDFSSSGKRGGHWRTVSDSVALVEPPIAADHGDRSAVVAMPEFDCLDDHQLVSMFSDVHVAVGKPLMSHRNIIPSMEETEDSTQPRPPASSTEVNTAVDPKRVKRILANRQSAQRSRVRKLQYISELERSVTYLQTEVSSLSPRVAFLNHQRSILTAGNSALHQRMAVLSQDNIFKDAQQEALRKEVERLSQVYHQQNLKNLASSTATAEPTSCSETELIS